MKVNVKIFVAALLYFILLITFEAGQQYYYVTRFDLLGNRSISMLELLKFHIIRWLIWALLAVPMAMYTLKRPAQHFSLALLFRYFLWVLVTLTLTLVAISIFNLWYYGNGFSEFYEVFLFFTYQKSALFVNAYLGLIIMVALLNNMKVLDAKIIALSDLKEEYQELHKKALGDTSPIVQIRIGKKLKNVLFSEIIWVQSDDYCVRVHTVQGAYHLRRSMKSMEEELTQWGFIRIHRNCIVNQLEIDTLVFSNHPKVLLKNGKNLAIAQSRVPKIKAFLKSKGLPA